MAAACRGRPGAKHVAAALLLAVARRGLLRHPALRLQGGEAIDFLPPVRAVSTLVSRQGRAARREPAGGDVPAGSRRAARLPRSDNLETALANQRGHDMAWT